MRHILTMLYGLWRIELLGRLRARNAERSVDRFRTEKQAILREYLSYFGDQIHSREHLAELLWPDTDVTRSRMSLRTALASLRRQLEPPGTPAGTVISGKTATACLTTGSFQTDIT